MMMIMMMMINGCRGKNSKTPKIHSQKMIFGVAENEIFVAEN